MTDKCKNKCCNLYDDSDENDNQFIIERLEDIIEISNFLIKVLKHKKIKEDTFDTLMKNVEQNNDKKDKEDKISENDIFFEILRDLFKNPSYQRYPYYYAKNYPYTVRF